MLLWPPVKIPACDGQVETQVWITEDSVDMQIHEGYFARSWICNWNCCCSVTRLCPTLWDLTDCSTTGLSLSFTVSRTLIKLISIESVMPSNHLILCYPLLLLTSIFPRIRVFSNESVLQIRWPKCWSFSFSISLSNEYLGLISFRTDWVWSPCSPRDSQDSSAAPQCESITSLVLRLLYGSTLNIYTWLLEKLWLWLDRPLLAKWCLCFLIHCQVCHSFSSKEQASFNSMVAVTVYSDFEENKSCHCFHCFPIYLPRSDETCCNDFSFENVEF